MPVKYNMQYKNKVGDDFQVLISQDSYVDTPIKIQGSATLIHPKVQSLLTTFRGGGLRLDLEAHKDLDFSDLYTENERDFSVSFYRNNILTFVGYIKPDGIYADFVSERWIISLDCIDGLGVLDNLRFVDDQGFPYDGIMREIDIIYYCLKRSGVILPINTDIKLYHDGIEPVNESNTDVLTQTKLNSERFIKDETSGNDDADIMSCEEVLKSVLQKYNAVIQQYNAEWYIFRPMDLFLEEGSGLAVNKFFRYVNNQLYGITTLNYIHKIGSNIDGYYPHHVNENQRIEIEGSVSAFRVEYAYGIVKTLLDNPSLSFDWGTLQTPNWETGVVDFQPWYPNISGGQKGIYWSLLNVIGNDFGNYYNLKLANPINVDEYDILTFDITYRKNLTDKILGLPIEIKSVSPSGDLYFTNENEDDEDNGWQSSGKVVIGTPSDEPIRRWVVGDGNIESNPDFKYQINIKVPADGTIEVKIFAPNVKPVAEWIRPKNSRDEAYLTNFQIRPSDKDKAEQGEWHTAWRDPSTSSNVEDSKKVSNGDMDSDIYVGAMKKLDGTNTVAWRKPGGDPKGLELLQIMAEDTIRMQNKPQKVFTGDIYGYIPPLMVLLINNIQGNFLPLSYEYDTMQNICRIESNEFFNDELEEQIEYEKTFDRGNVVKPTITN